MAEIANLQVTASVDMAEGEKKRFPTVVSTHDGSKELKLLSDVEAGVTHMVITIDKFPPIKAKAAVTKKKGEATKLLGLFSTYQYSMTHLVAQGAIKKGDALNVKIATP